jgi:hypothetical protein
MTNLELKEYFYKGIFITYLGYTLNNRFCFSIKDDTQTLFTLSQTQLNNLKS